MPNIELRNFLKKDLENLTRCLKYGIIPVLCTYSKDPDPAELLYDNMHRDDETNRTRAIVDKDSDTMIGGIDSYLIDDILLISGYVLPEYRKRGICTNALELFINSIRKNSSEVRELQFLFNHSNVASEKIAKRLGFSKIEENEHSQTWNLKL